MRSLARRLRADMTDAERALWRDLRQSQLGRRFRRQFPIPPFVVDFACLEERLIVEADGGQHAASRYDKWPDARLAAQGWRILRFWNNDILSNRAGVLRIIAEALGTYPHPNPPPLAGEGVFSPHNRPDTAGCAMPLATCSDAPPPPLAGEGWGGGS